MPNDAQIEVLRSALVDMYVAGQTGEKLDALHFATALAEAYEEAGWNYNVEEAPRDETQATANATSRTSREEPGKAPEPR